ncbi:MAG: hypothetical protein MHM6MM_006513, partial [Cercozoa sp. M6MM]
EPCASCGPCASHPAYPEFVTERRGQVRRDDVDAEGAEQHGHGGQLLCRLPGLRRPHGPANQGLRGVRVGSAAGRHGRLRLRRHYGGHDAQLRRPRQDSGLRRRRRLHGRVR